MSCTLHMCEPYVLLPTIFIVAGPRTVIVLKEVFLYLFSFTAPFKIQHDLKTPHSKILKTKQIIFYTAATSTHVEHPKLQVVYSSKANTPLHTGID